MKIAHIVCTYPPYYGGMGNVVFQTVEQLLARGHNVEVFTPQYDEPEEEDIDHVQRLAPSMSYGNAAHMPTLSRLLDAMDIVHLHYPFFGVANVVRRWKMRNPKKGLVITYHMDNRAEGIKGICFDLYRRFWMPRILGAADALIASSFEYLNVSDAKESFAARPDKWHELPFGVNTERFVPADKPAALCESLSLDVDVPTILFVGGMDDAHAFKDVPTLLSALLLLHKRGVPIQALFVGEGNRRAQYESRAIGYGIDHLVRFVGRVSDDDLPMYYNAGDVLVLPSMHRGEAFGMVLLEAYASGLPVIATDLAGVRTVAADAGIVVPPRDHETLAEHIRQYSLASVDERQRMAQRARQVATEKYDWVPIVDRLEHIYNGLAQ